MNMQEEAHAGPAPGVAAPTKARYSTGWGRLIASPLYRATLGSLSDSRAGRLLNGQHRLSAVIQAGEPIEVFSGGTAERDFTYVDDLVDGILAMLLETHDPGPVNIGNPHEISMRDLAQWIIELAGSSSTLEFIERPTDDPTVRRPDTTKAQRLLGWSPQVPVETGLQRTIEWFRTEAASAPVLTPGQTEEILNR